MPDSVRHGPTTLLVLATGPSVTVQDLGRPGWFAAGVGVSGAADRLAATRANRLVGNAPGAAVLEVLLGGLEVEVSGPLTVAVTGAPTAPTVDGTPAGPEAVTHLRAGQRLALGTATAGLRAYLAVRGGVDVPPVLGSRSRDTLAGIGPGPLRPGQVLPVGREAADYPVVDIAPTRAWTTGPVTVRARLGPRDDWFMRPDDLFAGSWVVSDRLDRVGVRLERGSAGPALVRAREGELPTEGMALGAVQVPPSGQPVVFLADHPVTGGYPVVAVVRHDDLPVVAQVRPGQELRFRPG